MSENRPPSDEIDDLDVSRKIADTTASTSISDRMTAAEQRLFISSREQQYLTEFRLGIIRLLTITLLYLIHLVSYLSAAEATTADTRFHLLATIVTLAWLVFGSIVLGALTLRSFPIWLGLATTVVDLVFVLAIAAMGNGARSPLVAVLFLLIIAAALRFDLRAIWVTTCVGCYWLRLLACCRRSWVMV